MLLLVAGVLPVWAWLHWAQIERAMRVNRPLPAPSGSLVLVGTGITITVLLTAGTLLGV